MKNKFPLFAKILVPIAMMATTFPAAAVELMSFNVENLFDTSDDPQKDDQTFLPLKLKNNQRHRENCARIEVQKWREQCLSWDWSESVVAEKLKRLTKVVKSVSKGKGPDVLCLQEVENLSILERWRSEHLKSLGYGSPVLIEGHDKRGIDVGVLTKLPVVGQPKLHAIPFKNADQKRLADTRGILSVDVRLPGKEILSVFCVHLPAPFHPPEMRVQALHFLGELLAKLPSKRLAVAMGDFNMPHGETNLLREHATAWSPAHFEACKGCRGSTYYAKDDSWSFLDMILFSKSFEAADTKWRWSQPSFRVVNGLEEQKNEEGQPQSFEPPFTGLGVSDHFPLAVTLERIAANPSPAKVPKTQNGDAP